MKTRGILFNIIGILIVIIIVLAGIIITTSMLERQEASLIGKKLQAQTGNSVPMSIQPEFSDTPDTDNSVTGEIKNPSELYAKLYVWEQGSSEIPREPQSGEHTMEQAVESARVEITTLIDLGALPQIEFENYTFANAELTAVSIPTVNEQGLIEVDGVQVSSNQGRWTVTFRETDTDDTLTAVCDARTGTIYFTIMISKQPAVYHEREQLFMFAKYHGLLRDDESISITADEGSVTIGPFILESYSQNGNILSVELQS